MSFVPAKLTSLDIYRDGGSLSVSFQRDSRDVFTLFLKVILAGPDRVRPIGFRPPVLETLKYIEYTSPVTSVTIPDWQKSEQPLSWEAAQAILNELAPQVAALQSEYLWVYAELVEAVENQGVPTTSE